MKRDFKLLKDIKQELFKNAQLTSAEFEEANAECVITVEIQLLFLEHVGLDNPFLAWAVLGGHHQILTLPNNQQWGLEELKRIQNLRLWLNPPSRYDIESMIDAYKKQPPDLCLFRITQESDDRREATFSRRLDPPFGLDDRESRLTLFQEHPPPIKPLRIQYATEGSYEINVGTESSRRYGQYTIEITPAIASKSPDLVPVPNTHHFRNLGEPPLEVEFTWAEILETAKWMDEVDEANNGRGNWYKSLYKKEFCLVENGFYISKKLDSNTPFRLQDLNHLVGMVNSGKSTFLVVAIVLLCRKYAGKFHATIILNEVSDILDKVRLYGQYGIKAVPFIGESGRLKHLTQVHASVGRECIKSYGSETSVPFGYVPVSPHPAFNYLFNSCPLGGYVLRKEFPLRPGSFPCRSLKTNSDEENPKVQTRWCPYLLQCPVNTAQVEAVDADVWITTPHGLIFISILPPLVQIPTLNGTGKQEIVLTPEMKLFEAVCRRSDLLVCDEADRAQVSFDDIFAPTDKMVGGGEGFLDYLDEFDARFQAMTTRSRQWNAQTLHYSDARDPRTVHWFNSIEMAVHTVNNLMTCLCANTEGRKIIGEGVFNGLSVANRIVSRFFKGYGKTLSEEESLISEQIATEEDIDALFDLFNQYDLDPLFRGNRKTRRKTNRPLPNNAFLISYGESEEIFEYLDEELEELFPGVLNKMDAPTRFQFVQAITILLWITILEYATENVLSRWDEVREIIGETPPPNVASWFERLNDYRSIVPLPPIGAHIGFRYLDDPTSSTSLLEHIRFGGIGRWVLYNAKNAFIHEGVIGPSTLLMSATSYAPGSSKFNLETPVTCILKVADEEIAEICKTKQTVQLYNSNYQGRRKFIRISGSGMGEKRDNNYSDLIKEIVNPHSPSTNDSDLETSFRDSARNHALLVCNSYSQVTLAQQSIRQIRGAEFSDKIWGVSRPEDPDAPSYGKSLERGSVELYDYLAPDALGLLAPLNAIERGHNILNRENNAAFSSVFFLIRPMPVPNDIMPTIAKLNYFSYAQWEPSPEFRGLGLQATQEIADELNIRPISGADDPATWNNYDRAANYRNELFNFWKRLIRGWGSFRALPPSERRDLAWTDLIIFVQTSGRCVRGNQAVNVFYCDGAFFPNYSKGILDLDTSNTSLLLAILEILQSTKAFLEDSTSENSEKEDIIKVLYGWFFESFSQAMQPFIINNEKVE